MSSEDPLKSLISEATPDSENPKSTEQRARKISSKVQSQQSQADLADFGLIKIWTVLLEMFSVFYAQTKEHQLNIKNTNNFKKQQNDKQEL